MKPQSIQNNYTKSSSYLDQPEQFPLSNEDAAGVPIALSDSVIGFVYENFDSLFFSTSGDSGKTWSTPAVILSGDIFISFITAVKTNSGRVMVVSYLYDNSLGTYQLRMTYSDDLNAWYTSTISDAPFYFFSMNLTCTNDDKLWLCFTTYNENHTERDLFYITSTNDGAAWSNETLFLSGPDSKLDGMIVSGSSDELLAFYSESTGEDSNIFEMVSSDGGTTWTSPVPVVNSGLFEFEVQILRQSGNTLWLFYSILTPANLLSGYERSDIQYVLSSDGGVTWGVPQRFTYFAGADYVRNAVLLYGKPFISFFSSRWAYYQSASYLWYGLIGKTEDSDPPPAQLSFTINAEPDELSAVVNTYVDDESGISDVKSEIFVNDVSQGFTQMYDDGMHNDFDANDYIWGTTIGPFNFEDTVLVTSLITDISGNTVNVYGSWFIPEPIHNAGDLKLSIYGNSQLSENEYSYGTGAFWHEYDYLFGGGLWIGADISGERRVMNRDYYDDDWSLTQGTMITVNPGLSDQDFDMHYDDGNSPAPQIGLAVHQRSYEWSTQGRDDFIIFEYTIKNSTSNNISNLYTSFWLDPDISEETLTYEDLGGYDPQRGMIYMYDPAGDPTGYLGSRLLTGTPSTAYLYTFPDPQTDDERYQLMTGGIMPVPAEPNDYRTILTSQPFSLAPGDSHTVAFGLVMGDGLEELKANADTMKALFDQAIVGNKNNGVNTLPVKFDLSQNYPNPFNPATKIKYAVPQLSLVQIRVYDILGKEIETLVSEEKPAGFYELNWNADNLPSGVYFYQLRAGSFVQTKKMILLK